jgi:ELWxxDGT repeat protein
MILDSLSDIQYETMTAIDGVLFYTAAAEPGDYALYRSNGTKAGTVLVKDINPGAEGSGPAYLFNVGGTLYFTANDGTHGAELYKSDGTEAGTVRLSDINPGAGGLSLREVIPASRWWGARFSSWPTTVPATGNSARATAPRRGPAW